MAHERTVHRKLETNVDLVSIGVLSALLVPQIITRALPSGAGLIQIYLSISVGLLAFVLVYFAIRHMSSAVPRRTSHQLVSKYLGDGIGVVVVSAHFVAYSIIAVLGGGLITDVLDSIVFLGRLRPVVLIELIALLSLPVLFGKNVSRRFVVICAGVGAIAIVAVLGWALAVEGLGRIDADTNAQVYWGALETKTFALPISSFMEAMLSSLFPAAVVFLMSERVLVAPQLRRVSVHLLLRIFGLLAIVILITLYFVGILEMSGYRLAVVTMSMAYSFWGFYGQIVVGMCYMLAGIAGVLAAYSHMPRFLRSLAIERFLPRRMADVESSSSRVIIVIAMVFMASMLSAFLTTTQAGAMVFIFIVFAIIGLVSVAMDTRMSAIAKNTLMKAERQRVRLEAWAYRIIAFFSLVVLISCIYVQWEWALASIGALVIPASILVFFRREKLKVQRSLEVDDLTHQYTLPTRVHGIIYIAGGIDASVVKAVSYARGMRLSSLTAITVDYDSDSTRVLRDTWAQNAIPAALTVLGSPRKASHVNVVDYVRSVRDLHPNDTVVFFMPRLISHSFVRSLFLRHSTRKMVSMLRMEDGVVLAEVPYVVSEGK